MPGAQEGQKTVSVPQELELTDGHELPSEFWKPNQVLWKRDDVDVFGILDLHLSKDFLPCLL